MPGLTPVQVLDMLLDPDSQLQAVRDIKNAIIGNRKKKTAFNSAGAVPRLVEILRAAKGELLGDGDDQR